MPCLKSTVLEAFTSIVNEYGYELKFADQDCVRLESSRVVLSILHDHRRSHEVGIELSEKYRAGETFEVPFNLREVFLYLKIPYANERWFCQSKDFALIREFLTDVSRALSEYGAELLRGNSDALTELGRIRTKEASDYMRFMQHVELRSQAEKAWHEKNYDEYSRLIGSLGDDLSEVEKRKLAYAASRK